MHNYRDLHVYQRSLALAKELVVHLKDKSPFSLTQQIVRSAISIPSNMSEGAERSSQKEFLRYLSISLGSAAELGTQLEIATSVFTGPDEHLFISKKQSELTEIRAMIRGLMNTIAKNNS